MKKFTALAVLAIISSTAFAQTGQVAYGNYPTPTDREIALYCQQVPWKQNPNYRDPSKGLNGAVGALLGSLRGDRSYTPASSEPRYVPDMDACAAQVAQAKAKQAAADAAFKQQQIAWAKEQEEFNRQEAEKTRAHGLTAAQVAKVYKEHPEIPHPIGYGMYEMRLPNGQVMRGSLEALEAAQAAHMQACMEKERLPNYYSNEPNCGH